METLADPIKRAFRRYAEGLRDEVMTQVSLMRQANQEFLQTTKALTDRLDAAEKKYAEEVDFAKKVNEKFTRHGKRLKALEEKPDGASGIYRALVVKEYDSLVQS